MAQKVVWTYPAREDLLSHLKYLKDKSPEAASRLYEEIEAAGNGLKDMPQRGRRVPELPHQSYREIIVASHRLVYRTDDDIIIIVRMIHGRPDFLRNWKHRRSS